MNEAYQHSQRLSACFFRSEESTDRRDDASPEIQPPTQQAIKQETGVRAICAIQSSAILTETGKTTIDTDILPVQDTCILGITN